MSTITQMTSRRDPETHAEQLTRLLRLDAKLESIRTAKLYHKITLTRGELRIDVHLSRGRASGYYASATVCGTSHSSWGKFPSHAIVKIVNQLNWTIDRAIVDENFEGGVARRLAA